MTLYQVSGSVLSPLLETLPSLNCNSAMSLWSFYKQDIGDINVLIVTG